MGDVVIVVTILLLLVFLMKHPRHFFEQMRRQRIGYCLFVEKYKKDDQYYLVFQQGEKEWVLTCSMAIYFKLQPPARGELFLSRGVFSSFEE